MLSCILVILLLRYEPIVIDSIMYKIDISEMEIQALTLKGNIIDYRIDDFIYVLSHRFLYKINYYDFSVVDRVPLPQTFHSFSLSDNDIFLITTNEIVIIDKKNFAFTAGIGIEYGDYQSMIVFDSGVSLAGNHVIYLLAHTGKNSVIKIFDLDEGRLVKKISVQRVISFNCDTENNTLMIVDSNNNVIIYDMSLTKKKVVQLPFTGRFIRKRGDDFIFYNQKGIFLIDNTGHIVDFQPMAINKAISGNGLFFLTDGGLAYVDMFTLRIKHFFRDTVGMKSLFHVDQLNKYAAAIDYNNGFYLIDTDSLRIEPMRMRKVTVTEQADKRQHTDSLWYFQLGAFTVYDNALVLYNQMNLCKIPVFIDSTDFYRVTFGGFSDKASALEIIEEIDLQGWFVLQKKIEREGRTSFFVGSDKYIFENGTIRKEY